MIAPIAAVFLTLLPSPAIAGGFQLSVETPGKSNDANLKGGVLVVRTYGCYRPADARLSATAEGLIGGRRRTVPLELHPIDSGGYAIRQQWPQEGTWVLALTGDYNGMTCSVLVELGPAGKVLPGTRLIEGRAAGVHAKSARRKWVAADIDSALRTASGLTISTSDEPETSTPLKAMSLLAGGLGAFVAITFATLRRSRG
jgi:hypothetical protein